MSCWLLNKSKAFPTRRELQEVHRWCDTCPQDDIQRTCIPFSAVRDSESLEFPTRTMSSESAALIISLVAIVPIAFSMLQYRACGRLHLLPTRYQLRKLNLSRGLIIRDELEKHDQRISHHFTDVLSATLGPQRLLSAGATFTGRSIPPSFVQREAPAIASRGAELHVTLGPVHIPISGASAPEGTSSGDLSDVVGEK